jgi:hypothetical protein
MTWQTRFDRLLKAMASGEPPKRDRPASVPPKPVQKAASGNGHKEPDSD